MATMRYEEETNEHIKEIAKKIEVIFTGRKAKLPYLKTMGIVPDLVIDNDPHWLFMDSR
jgi:hypothetical protein